MAYTIIDFHLNRDELANAYCENLDKGITVCYGKCYLDKKLKAEKKEEKNHEKLPVETNVAVFIVQAQSLLPDIFSINNKERTHDLINLYHFLTFTSIFHPPK